MNYPNRVSFVWRPGRHNTKHRTNSNKENQQQNTNITLATKNYSKTMHSQLNEPHADTSYTSKESVEGSVGSRKLQKLDGSPSSNCCIGIVVTPRDEINAHNEEMQRGYAKCQIDYLLGNKEITNFELNITVYKLHLTY